MKVAVGRIITAGFGVALLILGVVGFFSYRSLVGLIEAADLVTRTHQVVAHLYEVLWQIKGIQAERQGYVITGDARYLESHQRLLADINDKLVDLRDLMADNPVRQQQLAELGAVVANWIAFDGKVIALRREQGFTAAQELVRTGEGLTSMQEVRQMIGEIEAEERALLKRRNAREAARTQTAQRIIIIGSLLAVGLVAGAGGLVYHGLTERARAEVALQQAHAGLEVRVQDRTAELTRTNEALQDEITRRAQSEEHLQRQLQRLSLLNQITRATGERQDEQSIFRAVLKQLADHKLIDYGCVCSFDSPSNTLTIQATNAAGRVLAERIGIREGTVLEIERTGLHEFVGGQTVYVPNTERAQAPLLRQWAAAELRSLVGAPLFVESNVSGVLIAARCAADDFSSGESEFLRMLGEQLGLASHQVYLYNKLQRAYEDLRQTQQTALQQERLHALGQMASGIAHDINNALSPMTIYTESLLATESTLSPRAREYLQTIQRTVDDVANTVARMREFYRRQDDDIVLLPVELNQLSQQVTELTRARWRDMPQQHGIAVNVRLELQEELPAVLGVESEIREALTNLVFNAVDALPEGGTITLRTRVLPRYVVLEVADTGVGMDEETQQRCLEPFYTTKGERGSGLGLAMVYGIMQRHAGDLEIESAVGEGTTIRLVFPITQTAAAQTRPVETPLQERPLRILVVDDDPLVRKALQNVLGAEGHAVTIADGGQAGITAFRAAQEQGEPFAAVITDLGMPYVDGREVARAVKQLTPTTPVILLTGWGRRMRAEGDVPLHVDWLLSKPPRMLELRDVLRALCMREGAAHDII